MTLTKPVVAAILTATVSVAGAAAMAYTDVQVLKSEMRIYVAAINEIKADIREIRNNTRHAPVAPRQETE
jgi:uncharacterized protein YukE